MATSSFELFLSSNDIPFEADANVSSTLLQGKASLVVAPSSDEQLAILLPYLQGEEIPYEAAGSCSNTLLLGTESSPLKTTLISTRNLNRIVADGNEIIADAGVRVALLSKYAARASLTGLEFACDIPGTTAGAIATDAWHPIHNYESGFVAAGIDHTELPKQFSSVLTSAELINSKGELVIMGPEELEMHNRTSRLAQPGNDLFLLRAHFGLEDGDPELIAKAREVTHMGRCAMRAANKAKNPYSVGKTLGYSFVLNHPEYSGVNANKLVATAESLPAQLYDAGMYHSKETPNIICNTGRGDPDGYLRIADTIREAVLHDHGIEMPLEVRKIS